MPTNYFTPTHGLSKIPEYEVWKTMRQRCLNPCNRQYPDYGERGITICSRWSDFANFIKDMGRRPTDLHMIDRTDNDKGYFPENCRWVTRDIQNNNTRSNHLISYRGVTHTLSEWSSITGIPYSALRARRRRGWSASRALTQPLQIHPPRKLLI